MSKVKIATWNINSVRLRIGLIKDFDSLFKPDILCLQETKCQDSEFPLKEFRKLGYDHVALNGQKGYHGVATLSRIPFSATSVKEFCGKGDSRHVSVKIHDDVELHNFYVPSGGDVPDRQENEKFDHKLNFLKEMAAWFKKRKGKKANKLILVGDLNVAPLEADVWSHKQLLNVVSHTPIEVEHLGEVQRSHSWIDVTRRQDPEPKPIYTWWSYRSPDWTKNNRGRRLDHIWVTPALGERSGDIEIYKEARSWQKPSDHVPVMMSLDVSS